MNQPTASPLFSAILQTVLFAAVVFGVAAPGVAFAEDDRQGGESAAEMKEQFQREYRNLLRNAARLERNAATARDNYMEAQRRRYPRGAAREQLLVEADEAEKELAQLEVEIDRLRTEGRRDGALPGWFYEVESESFGEPKPASPSETDAEDREGRNPIHFDDE